MEQQVDIEGGITLCAETFGDASDPPLVLVAGLGQQMIGWPEGFCEELVGHGFHVVRFDNRDAGRSWHAGFRPPQRSQLVTRRFHPDQYSLADMAGDLAGLLDALGLHPAHVVGISMGGMIAQTLAAQHPDQVRSLVSIMSTTGSSRVGWTAPSTLRLMFRKPPRTRDEAAERAATMWQHIGSHGFPFDESYVRERAAAGFDRDPKGAVGSGRQLGAIRKSGDRTRQLRHVRVPTLVIHGDRDRMVHPSGGRATAQAVSGARLVTIPGLGHDLPRGAWPRLGQLIAEHAQAANERRASTEVAAR